MLPSPSLPSWTRCPTRARRRLGALFLVACLLLGACAQRVPRPAAAAGDVGLSDAHSRQLIGEWQRQLAAYLDEAGGGDPAALARLPSQRATGTLRPARIRFGALDLETSVSERDGFDVMGLLLDPLPEAGALPYLFVVGIVQRDGFQPVNLADIRLVAMTLRGRELEWTVGDSDPQALARYRAVLDPSVPLRFPADKDHFEPTRCTGGLCVDERNSAARWRLPLGATAAAAAAR